MWSSKENIKVAGAESGESRRWAQRHVEGQGRSRKGLEGCLRTLVSTLSEGRATAGFWTAEWQDLASVFKGFLWLLYLKKKKQMKERGVEVGRPIRRLLKNSPWNFYMCYEAMGNIQTDLRDYSLVPDHCSKAGIATKWVTRLVFFVCLFPSAYKTYICMCAIALCLKKNMYLN